MRGATAAAARRSPDRPLATFASRERRAQARGGLPARPPGRPRARHDAGRCPRAAAGAPGPPRRARGRSPGCSMTSPPGASAIRPQVAIDRSARARGRRGALARRHRLRPSVRRRGGAAAPICSRGSGGRGSPPRPRSPTAPAPPGRPRAMPRRSARSCRRVAPARRSPPCRSPRCASRPSSRAMLERLGPRPDRAASIPCPGRR